MKERVWTEIHLKEGEIKFFSILTKGKICPLKMKFQDTLKQSCNLYIYRITKYPNDKNYQEKIEFIKSNYIYNFSFGESELKKFNFDYLYLSIIALCAINLKMIFSLASEALFPKQVNFKLGNKNEKEKLIMNKKVINNHEILKNQIILQLLENEIQIKNKRKMNGLLNTNNEDYLRQNLDVKNNYSHFILNRKSNRNKDEQRISFAKRKKLNLLIQDLHLKTLLLHKWNLRKKQVLLIRMIVLM